MSVLTLDDVFQIILEVEETGQLFYEALGASCSSERLAAMCYRMSTQEKDHYELFEKMRHQYLHGPQKRHFSEDQIQQIIKQRIVPDQTVIRNVLAERSMELVLELAIDMEEDSVDLYRDLQQLLSDEDARVVERIIEEELQHAADLRADRKLLGE
jgi:rubrerythrin